jgi:hypothetical protein
MMCWYGREENVRFGSLADISELIRDVRFTLESGHPPGKRQCLLCALSGHPCPARYSL